MAATARQERELIAKSKKAMETATDPIEKLRAQCLARGASGIKGLGRVFRRMDDNGDRSLNYQEFYKGLNDSGVFLDDDAEYKAAFNAFDADGNGSLDFDEFLKALRPPMSKNRVKLIRMAFQKIDKDGNGKLTVEDLKGVYDVRNHPKFKTGEMDEDEILLGFLASFDTPGQADGTVEWEEFLNYYSGVSASIDSDTYFDLMMRQAWKL